MRIGCYLLKLTAERYEFFIESEKFGEPVSDFGWARGKPLFCFTVNKKKQITHFAKGKKGVWAGTGLRRLNLTSINKLDEPISLDTLTDMVPNAVKKPLALRIKNGGLIPPETSKKFVEAFLSLYPKSASVLAKYIQDYDGLLTKDIRIGLAKQKEAITTAFSIAKMDREPLQGWSFSENTKSFLDGLDQSYLVEGQMLSNDHSIVPGFEFIRNVATAAAFFRNDKGVTLTVIHADRHSLEKQIGTDLIYYNETFKSFIMVQYKVMEVEDFETYFRLPNKQLSEELSRMEEIMNELKKCELDNNDDSFRFNSNPFFFKFCPRIDFKPTDSGLTVGMYIHLDHWKLLEQAPKLDGLRKGKKLTYKNVGRYLDNESFVNLVSSSWVGTTHNQSKIIEILVKDTLESGRGVVLAIKKEGVKSENK